jgi:hypothetical protein
MKKIIIISLLITLSLCSISLAAVGGFILKEAGSAALSYLKEKLAEKLSYEVVQGNFRDTILENGKARFISNIQGGYVISMYWHKTKRHSATCKGGFLSSNEQKRTIAKAGEWAVAYCKAGIGGRKTYYNDLE